MTGQREVQQKLQERVMGEMQELQELQEMQDLQEL